MIKVTMLFTLLTLAGWKARGQELPDYTNSAMAWNRKTNTSIHLVTEETVRKDKRNVAGAFSKKAALVISLQLHGQKSKARIAFADTLKIFAKVDKEVDPKSIIKIYRASVDGDHREINVMQVSKKGEVERWDGDYAYSVKKLSPGVFLLDVIGTKAGDEIFFYIGTNEVAMAKLTLGID